jgi:hypothetical protein
MPFVPTLPNFETACELWVYDHTTGSQDIYVVLDDDLLCQPCTVDPRDLNLEVLYAVIDASNSVRTNYIVNPCINILLPKDMWATHRAAIDPMFLLSVNYAPALIAIQDPDDSLWYGYLILGVDRRYPDFPNEHYIVRVNRVTQAWLNAATGKTTI